VIHEQGESWWNINRGKLLIFPLDLSGNPTSSHLVKKAGGTGKGNYEFGLAKCLCSHLEDFLTCRKILQHGANGFTSPLKEGMLPNFNTLKNPSPSAGF
jgi:hypothetical protein